MNEEYRTYNNVVVTLDCADGRYTVSTINTGPSSLNDKSSGPHLESISIDSPSIGGNQSSINPSSIGAKGTITLTDYKEKVFNALASHFTNYKNANTGVFPHVTVHIDCWAGSLDFYGFVNNWRLSYTGLKPSIVIEWGQFQGPSPDIKTEGLKAAAGSTWSSPGSLLKAIHEDFPESPSSNRIHLVVHGNDGKTYKDGQIDSIVQFNAPVEFNPANMVNRTSNNQLNAIQFLASKCVDKDGKDMIAYLDTNPNGTTIILESALDANGKAREHNNNELDSIVFVLNSHYAPYTKQSIGNLSNKYIIPITNFNYEMNLSNLCLSFGIIQNPNGNTSITNNGNDKTVSTTQNAAVEMSGQSTTTNNLTMSFDCYNVALFSNNDLQRPIHIVIFNEYGELHPLSKAENSAVVSEFNYSLDGAVLKASIKCTTVYNNLIRSSKSDKNGNVTATVTVS